MKISDVYIFSNNPAVTNSKEGSTESGDFAQMLSDMVEQNVSGAEAGQQKSPTQAVSATQETELPDLWYQVNNLLDTLDQYSQALGDPNRTLKQMEPLVRSMQQQAESLETQLGSGDDESLDGLAAQTVISAKVESMKYWRGDYVA